MARILLLFFIIQLSILYSRETYPVEKSYTLEPKMSSGIILGLSGSNGNGGTIEAGADVVDLFENVSLGFTTGFNYLEGSEVINYSNIGLTGGYVFHINKLMRINPTGGLSVIVPYVAGSNVTAEVTAGVEVDFHIFKRNMLLFRTTVAQSFNESIGPRFTFQFGIKRSIPMFISVPHVRSKIVLTPERFSPDGDGYSDNLVIKVDIKNSGSIKEWTIDISDESAQSVYKWSGHKKPPKLVNWDGYSKSGDVISSATDYKVTFTTVDYLGNRHSSDAGFLSDILVVEENDRFRINVPSIIFPPNSSDMSKLTKEQMEKNSLILGIIATKLQKYPDYRIRIEGHGNIVNWDSADKSETENRTILVPLTKRRAEAVKELLIQRGMSAGNISITGLGGDFPLVPFGDRENNWKNRRVEFILLK